MKNIIFIFLTFIAANAYAIPLPKGPGDAFLEGLNAGSNFGSNIIAAQQAQEIMRIQRQEQALRQLQMEIMEEQLRQLKSKKHQR